MTAIQPPIMITFQSEGIEIPKIDIAKTSRWLVQVASNYGKRIGEMVYRFCTDEIILKTNREFLGHDYFTDIITFDYSIGNKVGGDIIISVDTVATNAEKFNVSFDDELNRVIVHGLLHLCGLKDKNPEERRTMEAAENAALEVLKNEI